MRPANSSMRFGLLPAAGITAGASINIGTLHSLDERHPVSRANRQNRIVELVPRAVQPDAVHDWPIADPKVAARTCRQHERKVFTSHARCHVTLHLLIADDLRRRANRLLRRT